MREQLDRQQQETIQNMPGLNWNSHQLTHGWQRGVTAFFYGLGLDEADFDRAQVGIGVPLLDGNLCNVHAYATAQHIVAGCQDAGLIGFPFGVPSISDNITQGHAGGNASLPSRNMIASAAECVVSAHCYDAMVGLHHCDKNGPGFAMALARLNYPGLIVSGGSIRPGCFQGRAVTILDVYDSQAAAAVGAVSREEAEEVLRVACPGPGGCGIAASFNTWGIAMEAIGLMMPSSSSHPADDPTKEEECRSVGRAVRGLLERNLRPREILTRPAFENAAATIAAMGGSTNGILHLLALAQEAEIDFTLRDIQAILRRTPVLCSFAPRGKQTMWDLHQIGGTPVLLKHLLAAGVLHGDCLTVTGDTLAANLAAVPAPPADQELLAPLDAPLKPFADMQICFGNLAPGGIVFKVSSMPETNFRGRANVFLKRATLPTPSSRAESNPAPSLCSATWVPSRRACQKSSSPRPRWPYPSWTAKSHWYPIRASQAFLTERSASTAFPKPKRAGRLRWSRMATRFLLIFWKANVRCTSQMRRCRTAAPSGGRRI